jgi:hypothetical protein
MKKIITHISPHLDEIFAIWALKKFDPAFAEVEVKFKATNPQGGEVNLEEVDKDPNIVYLGLGRGKFDEHALEKEAASKVSAASLVWEDLKSRGLAPKDQSQNRGVEKLLDYILKEDLGELKSVNHYLSDYDLASIWKGFSQVNRGDSDKKLAFGLPLMDYLFAYLTGIAIAEEEIKSARTFETPWGKAVALSTDSGALPIVAYRQGFVLLVNITKKLGYHIIQGSTDSSVDLTAAYQKVRQIDPEADWYLHQSKRMLLSGSHSAPNVKISKLSLDQMIDLVKA